MAIPTIDAVVGDVMQMAELEGLLDELVRPRNVRRSPQRDGKQDEARHESQGTEEAYL
jgi:hypothetical protein